VSNPTDKRIPTHWNSGTCRQWQDDDAAIESRCIITRAANDRVRPINGRMPVIIAAEDYDR
jgi:putative SOS response-associated peptidase YedK